MHFRSTILTYSAAHSKGQQQAEKLLRDAAYCSPDYGFPSTRWDHLVLNWAKNATQGIASEIEKSQGSKGYPDANVCYFLGNLYYAKKRKQEAINCWEEAVQRGSNYAVVFRNLGLAHYNFCQDGQAALANYEKAFALNPNDARLIFELDQLKKKLNHSPAARLEWLRQFGPQIAQRDDLAIEYSNLLVQNGHFDEAVPLLSNRNFHPWEGGEGKVLAVWALLHCQLAESKLQSGEPDTAISLLEKVLNPPQNLGETWHPLQNQSCPCYLLGLCYEQKGETATQYFHQSSAYSGDFSTMEVQNYSENSYYSALSLRKLGNEAEAKTLFEAMIAYGAQLQREKAKINYFATSLPAMLVFEEDIQMSQKQQGLFVEALGYLGLGQKEDFQRLRATILTAGSLPPCRPTGIGQEIFGKQLTVFGFSLSSPKIFFLRIFVNQALT